MYNIVKKHADNLDKLPDQLHSEKNLVLIPGGFTGSLHGKISGYYGSKQFIGGKEQVVRNYIKDLSFDEQYVEGIEVIKLFGGSAYIK